MAMLTHTKELQRLARTKQARFASEERNQMLDSGPSPKNSNGYVLLASTTSQNKVDCLHTTSCSLSMRQANNETRTRAQHSDEPELGDQVIELKSVMKGFEIDF